MKRNNLIHDQNGAVLVETAVMLTLFLVFILGAVDFMLAFYQWNAATKAVAVGARIAAVSDPVASGLNKLSAAVVGAYLPAGAPMPAFVITCDGARTTCVCEGACDGVGGYDRAAMNAIVFGRGSESCFDATSYERSGMCDILPAITPANIVVTYRQTGMGYAGRLGGPAPTITLAVRNLALPLFFLRGLPGADKLQMPPLTTSITAEDLSSTAPSF
jgi:hypothetical protein